MWLLRGSPGLLWKHLPLILHGVKGLMNMAPCILTNATFNLVSPLCLQKDVWHRDLEKNTHFFVWHSSQNCPQSQHSPLAHNTTARGGQLRHRELDNIIVEQQDPHKLTWARSSWTVQRQSHGSSKSLHLLPRSVFSWGCWNTATRMKTQSLLNVPDMV